MTAQSTNPSLGETLVARGLLTPEQLTEIEAKAQTEGTSIETIITREKLVFPEAMTQVKAEVLAIPYVDINKVKRNPAAMRDISRQAAATYRFFVFDEKDGKLQIAMEDPSDFQALQAVRFLAKKRGLEPEIYLSSKEGMDRVLGMSAEIQAEIGGALKEFSQELEDAQAISGKKNEEVERLIEEAPISRVVAVMMRHAIEGSASDIHVEPTAKDLRIRYRIDGKLHTSLILPLKMHAAVISRIKILANLKIDESRLPQDGRFTTTTEGRVFDFRVSVMPTAFGEKAALRILDKSGGAPSFDELGLWGKQQEMFRQHLDLPNGIILISGPTGSGKSTTLFTALSLLNTPEVNIVTLEDPVEYEIEGVNQTQVHPSIGLTFASGLRSMLRQDPDVIMVGEIRDRDTAELAIHASLTGHLVLSTIHTNDAIGAIPRLVDMGIDSFLLTASLRLVAAQRLVSRLCQNCKQEIEIPAKMKEAIVKELAAVPAQYKLEANQQNPKVVYTSPGCPACHEGSSVGRLAIFEVVPLTKGIRTVMSESPNYDTIKDAALQEKYLTMRQDGLLKALAGQVLFEDVMRVTSDEYRIE